MVRLFLAFCVGVHLDLDAYTAVGTDDAEDCCPRSPLTAQKIPRHIQLVVPFLHDAMPAYLDC